MEAPSLVTCGTASAPTGTLASRPDPFALAVGEPRCVALGARPGRMDKKIARVRRCDRAAGRRRTNVRLVQAGPRLPVPGDPIGAHAARFGPGEAIHCERR